MRKTESLAFTALLCGIHILLIFASEYLPFFDLALVFFLPIFSAILAIKTQPRYSLILFIATMLIGLLINPVSTLLYIMSPLVFGIGYGLLVKYKAKATTIVYLLTILSMGLLLLDIKILDGFLDQNFMAILCDVFHLDVRFDSSKVVFIFLLFGFAQAFMIHFIMKYILKRMKVNVLKNEFPPLYLIIAVIAFIVVAIVNKKNHNLVQTSTICAVFFAVPFIVHGYRKNNALVPLLIAQAVIFLAVCVPCLKVLHEDFKIVIFSLILVPPLGYGLFRMFKEKSIKDLLLTI